MQQLIFLFCFYKELLEELTVLCGAEAAAVKRPEERLTVRLVRER